MRLLQALPLNGVARVGRFFGGLVYYCDARHRRVAIRNLTLCFGAEKSPAEIRAIARENFKRIGENFSCPVKMAIMGRVTFDERIELAGTEKLTARDVPPSTSVIMAVGHFGNFELLAHLKYGMPTHEFATTYRAVRNPAVNKILGQLRASTGCLFFERRSEGAALRNALRTNNLVLGLLSDQHSGDNGLRLPFLGHDCNTSKAPAIFALRFNAPLYTAICYRTQLAHWRVEVGEEIPTHENGQPRSLAAIMLDVNRAFEAAVRRDPANWFWVHNRWKKSKLIAVAEQKDQSLSSSGGEEMECQAIPINSKLTDNSSSSPPLGERVGVRGRVVSTPGEANDLEDLQS
jgi:KDO2-lipid IV(A) lauroyltransferase